MEDGHLVGDVAFEAAGASDHAGAGRSGSDDNRDADGKYMEGTVTEKFQQICKYNSCRTLSVDRQW